LKITTFARSDIVRNIYVLYLLTALVWKTIRCHIYIQLFRKTFRCHKHTHARYAW